MLLSKLHLAVRLVTLLAILEKIIFMTLNASGSSLNDPITDIIFFLGFIFFNIVAFFPFLTFSRKPYDSVLLVICDLLFFAGILWLSIGADYEIRTGTDAQTGLVYIGVPPFQIAAVILLVFIHAGVYIVRKTSK